MERQYVVLLVLLLLLNASAHAGVHKVHIQRKPKNFEEYVSSAGREAQAFSQMGLGLSPGPWNQDVETFSSDYCITVTIGTPPQPFSVLLRTNFEGMWVPSAMCPIETYDMCRDHRRYDRSKSTTYVREGQMFGFGHMYSELSYDTVGIAGQRVKGQSFAEAFQYAYNDSSIPYDGLLGLGMRQRIFSNDSSIFTNMIEQNIIDEIVYGMYFLKNSSDPSKSGGLVIGGRDPTLFHGNLTYVPSTYDTVWQFNINEILLLESDLPPLCKGGCTAVPYSGSHFIISSSNLMDELHRRLGAITFNDDHTYHFNCNGLHKLQPIYFSIGTALFELPWQNYVDEVVGPQGETICLSSFVGVEDSDTSAGFKDGFSLGDAFFTSVYMEFDASQQRMGFGQLVSSLSPH